MSALFTTFGIDWHLLVAQTINFLILATLLTYLLYKPVLKMVKERERLVAKGVDDAEEAAKRLEDADKVCAVRVGEAEVTADQIVKTSRSEAGNEKTRIIADAQARAAQVERDAEARAKETAAKSLRESEQEIARLAILAAEKVILQKS